MKLKEAPGAKADPQVAQRDKSKIGSGAVQTAPAPSVVAPSTPAQALVTADAVTLAIQPNDIARNPVGGVRAGGDLGGAAQPGGNFKNNVAMQESKAAASLGVLLSPAPTNTVLAFSVNGPLTADNAFHYSFQKSPALTTNTLFGNTAHYYEGLQSPLQAGISTNSTLFADNRANVETRFYLQDQNKPVSELTRESERLAELRAVDSATVSLGKAVQDLKQVPETSKASVAQSGVNKVDNLAQQSRSIERQSTTWKFIAEEQFAGNEREMTEVRLRSEADERLRRSRTAAKPALTEEAVVASPVLTSFQVDLNGDRIRLTDADGSVYEGTLAANKEAWMRKDDDVKAKTEVAKRPEDLEKKQPVSESAKAVSNIDAEPVSFRVSGTNRTLQQLVVIDATLSAPSRARGQNAARGVAAHFSETAGTTQAPPASAPAPIARLARTNSASIARSEPARAAGSQSTLTASVRIQGRARIGATNEVSINAVRVAP
jgi:hypothetical protein